MFKIVHGISVNFVFSGQFQGRFSRLEINKLCKMQCMLNVRKYFSLKRVVDEQNSLPESVVMFKSVKAGI